MPSSRIGEEQPDRDDPLRDVLSGSIHCHLDRAVTAVSSGITCNWRRPTNTMQGLAVVAAFSQQDSCFSGRDSDRSAILDHLMNEKPDVNQSVLEIFSSWLFPWRT